MVIFFIIAHHTEATIDLTALLKSQIHDCD